MEDLGERIPGVDELLDRLMDICPFPATAHRLMALTNDNSVPIDVIATAVASDPALTTQVLRVANSAAFRPALAAPVRQLRQALVNIGLEPLRSMAGAMALLATFATRDEVKIDLPGTSAVSGSIAAAVTQNIPGIVPSLSFLCGLLCEVGALACIAVDGPGFVELWHRVAERTGPWSDRSALLRDDLERTRYGATTRTIGARLLRRHFLPTEIADAIEAEPRQPEEGPLLHRATAFARLATHGAIRARTTADTASLIEEIGEIANYTSLVEIGVSELVRRCQAAAAQAERTLRATRGGSP
jgi:HD-like signal output (HDOD) protein